ncbi:hypothetical protein YTPLAS18_07640 [Nitrospira sp.]|nr:hypothetical protein YTPLAS18_07640 [Nitrospira sp.]
MRHIVALATSAAGGSSGPAPQQWEQLDHLPNRRKLVALQDGRILEIEGNTASLFHIEPAPDGVYHLARSGQLVVTQGLLKQILGSPVSDVGFSNVP